MPPPAPISADEFARLLKKCCPPHGWLQKIAVSNSGGPDSTCLLFLLQRHIQILRANNSNSRPGTLFSFHVDHALQPDSAAMAQVCEERATALGAIHKTTRVPWGRYPFPPKPADGDSFEAVGRKVRYRLLLQRMVETDTEILALGHHGDDQVETSLMRIAKGTTELGAGGMRRVRRWGMGLHNDELEYVGMAGMKRWMVRPLLGIGKDRLLATCDEHNLEYITDPTNAQPEITLRNAIRTLINNNSFDPEVLGPQLPAHIAESLHAIKSEIANLESVDMDPSGGLTHLREQVGVLTDQVEDVDSIVDSALNRCHLPSPTGTYLVSCRGLSTVRDPLVQTAMVLRIMRYCSFFAWGTIRADANRRRSSLQRIVDALWTPDPFEAGIQSFVAGGGVSWTPVLIGRDRIRMYNGKYPPVPKPGDVVGWLASRQVPFIEARLKALGMPNVLKVHITDQVRDKLMTRESNPGQILEVLWDCRFLVTIDIDRIPQDIVDVILQGRYNLWIHAHSRWHWPKITLLHAGGDPTKFRTLHTTLHVPEKGLIPLDRDIMTAWPPAYSRDVEESVDTIRVDNQWPSMDVLVRVTIKAASIIGLLDRGFEEEWQVTLVAYLPMADANAAAPNAPSSLRYPYFSAFSPFFNAYDRFALWRSDLGLPAPGTVENLQKETKSTHLNNFIFDGARADLTKSFSMSPLFQVTHSFALGSQTAPPSYNFGGIFASNKVFMQGGVDHDGNVSGRYNYGWTSAAVTKVQAQLSSQIGHNMIQLEQDYQGSDFSLNAKAINPSPTDGTGIYVGSYLQSLTKNLALGAEGIYQHPTPGVSELALSYLAKLTSTDKSWIATAQTQGLGVLQATYWQKLSEKVEVAADLQLIALPTRREAITTIGAKYDLRLSTFRAQMDSTGKVAALLEQRFTPTFAFLLAGEIDHFKNATKVGVGVMIESSSLTPEEMGMVPPPS
ncbi:ATP-bind-3 domain-containing protein [Mycena kentingensis (nom. inval.)]|nr:ATP-bind-3 domain-containing protein [Mycena kentingensis (nom. inval.)]